MPITLTRPAADRVLKFIQNADQVLGLRLGVKTTGCSGMAYVVDLAKKIGPGDTVYETNGIKVVIDAKSLPFVEGTEIDFTKNGLNEGFVYQNPNVKSLCGCGESFGI